MAPSNAPELDEYYVRQSVVLFVALVRKWLVTRDPDIAKVIAPIVARARDDARDRDEFFVTELHEELTALYRNFQAGTPADAVGRESELRHLFGLHLIGLTEQQLTDLDMTPGEIAEARGPSDAARENLAKALGIGAKTISNYRARRGIGRPRRYFTLEEALADPRPPPETRRSPIDVYRWRETLRAARAIHYILVEFLGATRTTARAFLKAWRTPPRL
ncbi:MAG TPA: hypothetical protein VGH28_02170 [Polyangiaceae bacterium]|jgi:hypothetical protein